MIQIYVEMDFFFGKFVRHQHNKCNITDKPKLLALKIHEERKII